MDPSTEFYVLSKGGSPVEAKFLEYNGSYVIDPNPEANKPESNIYLPVESSPGTSILAPVENANPNNYLIVPADYSISKAEAYADAIAKLINSPILGEIPVGQAGAAYLLYSDFKRGGSQDLQRSYNGSLWNDPTGRGDPFVGAFRSAASWHLGFVAQRAGVGKVAAITVANLDNAFHGVRQLDSVNLNGIQSGASFVQDLGQGGIAQNQVGNGSFEDEPNLPDSGYARFNSLPDWTTNPGSAALEVCAQNYRGIAGGDGHWLDTQGSPGGIDISQGLVIQAGTPLRLSFIVAAGDDTTAAEHLQFLFDGKVVKDISLVDFGGSLNTFKEFSANLTGQDGPDTLRIRSVGAISNIGFSLEHVYLGQPAELAGIPVAT